MTKKKKKPKLLTLIVLTNRKNSNCLMVLTNHIKGKSCEICENDQIKLKKKKSCYINDW